MERYAEHFFSISWDLVILKNSSKSFNARGDAAGDIVKLITDWQLQEKN